MVSVEGEEGGELHPAIAEFFVGVPVKAARVDAEHGYAEEGEREGLRDREEHVGPAGVIVSTPVAGKHPTTCECGASNYKGSFAREDAQ